nr:MAG TPA: hypothetical protein [Caudoviricetes sp.]
MVFNKCCWCNIWQGVSIYRRCARKRWKILHRKLYYFNG